MTGKQQPPKPPEPPKEDNPATDEEFEGVVQHFLNTPPKPRDRKKKARAPKTD